MHVSSGNNITITNIESSNTGIRQYGTSSNVTIKNSILNEISIYGGDDVLIQNNTLKGLGLSRIGDDCNTNPVYRFKIIGNTITVSNTIDIMAGICIPGCLNWNLQGLIENNTITESTNSNMSTALVYFRSGISNTTIRNNRITTLSGTAALYIRDGISYNLIENNYLESNGGIRSSLFDSGGNEYQDPTRNIFRNNTFKGTNSDAIVLLVGESNTFENNVFWSDGNGAYNSNWIGGNEIFTHNTFYHQGSNNSVFGLWKGLKNMNNNIFYSLSSSPYFFGCDGTTPVLSYNGDNNIFYGTGFVNLCGNPSPYNVSLNTWKLQTGDDANSLEANPMFVNAPAGDLRLQFGSPGCNINGGYAGAYPCSGSIIYTCTDSDIVSYPTRNYTLKGTVNNGTNSYTDSCFNSTVLNEYYCGSSSASSINNISYTCENGCSNSSCNLTVPIIPPISSGGSSSGGGGGGGGSSSSSGSYNIQNTSLNTSKNLTNTTVIKKEDNISELSNINKSNLTQEINTTENQIANFKVNREIALNISVISIFLIGFVGIYIFYKKKKLNSV